jgi:cell division septum initiation protein DivIVA
LEELILASPRLPFTSKTLVDEDLLLDQLDAIRLNLPPAFRQAVDVLHQRRTLITDADRHAQDLIAAAEQQAAQILNETGILQKAEQMAQQLKAQTQADCDHLRSQVLADLEATKLQAQREWEILSKSPSPEDNIEEARRSNTGS